MTPKDKLALGMSLFVLFFGIAFMFVPVWAYQSYFTDLNRRKYGLVIKVLLALVFALSLPYFYDELVGLDSKRLSLLLQVAMGACAYVLVIDVAWYSYKNFRRPSGRKQTPK